MRVPDFQSTFFRPDLFYRCIVELPLGFVVHQQPAVHESKSPHFSGVCKLERDRRKGGPPNNPNRYANRQREYGRGGEPAADHRTGLYRRAVLRARHGIRRLWVTWQEPDFNCRAIPRPAGEFRAFAESGDFLLADSRRDGILTVHEQYSGATVRSNEMLRRPVHGTDRGEQEKG
ncbi:MAG TPA: hypothetical protein VGI81_25515 [Tepidisphaeraceae bacterium]|jgi:hypothetical protein